MEEALEGVQTGAVKTLQLTQAQDKLKFDDHSYIQVWAHCMQNVSAKCSHVQTFNPLSRHTIISQYINRTLSAGPQLVPKTLNINIQHTTYNALIYNAEDLGFTPVFVYMHRHTGSTPCSGSLGCTDFALTSCPLACAKFCHSCLHSA